MTELALGIGGLEEVLVADLDADEAVRQVLVRHGPVTEGPTLVGEDDLDHQHIGDGVADGLVDEVGEGGQDLERVLLGRGLRRLRLERLDGVLREQHRPVAVRLEVHADVERARGVVQVLHPRRRAHHGQLQVLLDVARAGAVGVGRLHDADAQGLLVEPRGPRQVRDERRGERRDPVPVEHEEPGLRVDPVVDEAVGVAVQRAPPVPGRLLRARRRPLPRLDEVRPAVQVQHLRPEHVVVVHLDVQPRLRLRAVVVLEELAELGPAHAVGAVDRQGARHPPAPEGAPERLRELLVVPGLADLAVGLGRPFGVDGPRQVVQLRRGQDLVVDVGGVGGGEGVGEGRDELDARGPRVPAGDDLARGGEVDLLGVGEVEQAVGELLVRRGVDQLRGEHLPVLLQHVAQRVHDLDAVVRRGVVARRDHDADGLPAELAAPQRRQQSHPERHPVEQVRAHPEPRRAVLVQPPRDDVVLLRSRDYGVSIHGVAAVRWTFLVGWLVGSKVFL